MLIAAVGMLLDQPILIVGAMVVGPEFGPLAGALRGPRGARRDLARRSLVALAVGFPVASRSRSWRSLVFRAIGAAPDDFVTASHPLTDFISNPDFFSFFVAFLAGVAGMLSLHLREVRRPDRRPDLGHDDPGGGQRRRRGGLRGLRRGRRRRGAARHQPRAILVAGVLTLFVQRRFYVVTAAQAPQDPAREAAGLPLGRSAAQGAPLSRPLRATTRCRSSCARARSPRR